MSGQRGCAWVVLGKRPRGSPHVAAAATAAGLCADGLTAPD